MLFLIDLKSNNNICQQKVSWIHPLRFPQQGTVTPRWTWARDFDIGEIEETIGRYESIL